MSIVDEFDEHSPRHNPRSKGTRKKFCKRGHEYTEANTRWRLVNGRKTRRCRACDRLVEAKRHR